MPIPNVLVVDDNHDLHELFRCYAVLHDDLKLAHATSLDEAMNHCCEVRPDLVLLDNCLTPYKSYRETVPLLRTAGYKGRIVVISADVNDSIFDSAASFSVHECIDKFDFSVDSFRGLIASLLSSCKPVPQALRPCTA